MLAVPAQIRIITLILQVMLKQWPLNGAWLATGPPAPAAVSWQGQAHPEIFSKVEDTQIEKRVQK